MAEIEIRNDDVLIHENYTRPMVRALMVKPMFDWFKDTDQWFEERNIPMILAVVADGIDVYPEWVEYVKARQHRYRIELHCHTHINFRHLDEDTIYDLLMPAKDKIEKTFDCEVHRWYAPFSKRGFPGGDATLGMKVAERMGIRFHTKGNGPIPHRYFHFWNPRSVDSIHTLIEKYGI